MSIENNRAYISPECIVSWIRVGEITNVFCMLGVADDANLTGYGYDEFRKSFYFEFDRCVPQYIQMMDLKQVQA